MSITFSSCFYIIKAKFEAEKYVYWMNNFISIVKNFYLVIYTDESSSKYINTKDNPNIKIIIKPISQFYNYKYKEHWIENHVQNIYLNSVICWELNMLWSEKAWFVKETCENNYFNTDLHGWCDIGYFRNRENDKYTIYLQNWCSKTKIEKIDPSKIHYACVNNDNNYLQKLSNSINSKNEVGLPIIPIPPYICSIGGGFFIIHKNKINWWCSTLDDKLQLYFNHKYLVKDDQIILADCIFTSPSEFTLYTENYASYDNWFMFQRILN